MKHSCDGTSFTSFVESVNNNIRIPVATLRNELINNSKDSTVTSCFVCDGQTFPVRQTNENLYRWNREKFHGSRKSDELSLVCMSSV